MNQNCAICEPPPMVSIMSFGLPSHIIICRDCHQGIRNLISLTDKLQNEKGLGRNQSSTYTFPFASSSSSRGPAITLKCMEELMEREEKLNAKLKSMKVMEEEEELNEKLNFLSGFVAAFKEQMHADIMVKPGTDEPSLSTHRALLATRSVIFKHMLDSDECKAPPNDTVTFQELNYEELESLLEFLYTGDLPKDKVDKHVYSLSIAANKYQIPFLQKFCQKRMIRSLSSSNALDVLEIADTCSDLTLKENAINFITKNMKDVVLSDRFDAFAHKNPHLTVQITRAPFTNN